MYKITLYDNCCSPVCDGTFFFFVDKLEDFERDWLSLQSEKDISTIDRYYKSKFGEIITDYYSDSSELNIVQTVEFVILDKLDYEYDNINIELENTYNWCTTVNFDNIQFRLMKVKVNNEYMLLGQYKGIGGKRVGDFYNRFYNKNVKYCQMNFYGNPIAKYKSRYADWDKIGSADAYKDFYTDDDKFYHDEVVETFVWLPIEIVSEDYEIKRLDNDQIKELLRDIVGEAG
jgi:hypothetical protein